MKYKARTRKPLPYVRVKCNDPECKDRIIALLSGPYVGKCVPCAFRQMQKEGKA